MNNGGVSFNCTSSGGSFNCQGERLLNVNDGTLGFAGQYFQWDLTGTISTVPVPAARGYLVLGWWAFMEWLAVRRLETLVNWTFT